MNFCGLAIALGLLIASFVISTLIIRLGIPRLHTSEDETPKPLPESVSTKVFDMRATGFWIGFCETFLIFLLVIAGEFSALAIIIGAKEFVRNKAIIDNPSYYLLGTLANLAVAVLFALVAAHALGATLPGQTITP
ncbi:MAG: hypothetical protein R3C40_11030 [Parvularculaceae bacterium]